VIEMAKTNPRNGMISDDLGRSIILIAIFALKRGRERAKRRIHLRRITRRLPNAQSADQ